MITSTHPQVVRESSIYSMMYVYRAPCLHQSHLSLSPVTSALHSPTRRCPALSTVISPLVLSGCTAGDLNIVGTSSGGPHLARRKHTLILISLAYFWSLILLDSSIFCVFIECKGIQFYLCVHCCLQSGECLESSRCTICIEGRL